MVLLLPCSASHEGSEKKHQCIPFIQKDNRNTETGSTVNLSSLFYEEDGLFNKDIHIISHFSTSN